MRSLLIAGVTLLTLAFSVPSPLNAEPITWTLDNVTTSNGGQFTGSFVYDADTGVYSSVLITHVPDSTEPSALTFSTLEPSTSTDLVVLNGAPNPDGFIGRDSLSLLFANALTDQGGMIDVTGGATFFSDIRSETIDSGTVDATPASAVTPEPSSLALLGTGVVGLAGIFRRRFA